MRAPKSLRLPRPKELQSNKLDAIQNHLQILYEELDRAYRLLKDDMESGGMATKTWRIKEAETADVSAGNANAVGDLMFQRKIAGTWTTSQKYRGS